jgi:hypothetical protein
VAAWRLRRRRRLRRPISYAFDDAERATAGLLSLVDHGGIVLGSVMSLLGSWRLFMPGIVREIAGGGATMQDMRTVWETGDTRINPARCTYAGCSAPTRSPK